jgi:hypothetical protein
MVAAVNSTDDYSSEKMTVRYYVDEVGSENKGLMFEDDGETFRSPPKDPGYELLSFIADGTREVQNFVFKSMDYDVSLPYSERMINLEIIGLETSEIEKVLIKDGSGLTTAMEKKGPLTVTDWYLIDQQNRQLNVRFEWKINTNISISIHK